MRFTLGFARVLACHSLCGAYPIEFRHQGTGSGTLGGTPFSAQPFLIRGFGDTSNRQSAGADVFFIDHDLATIDLGGNTYTFTVGTRTFVNNDFDFFMDGTVGFSRVGEFGTDLLDGPLKAEFATWDMLSAIGPFSGDGGLLQWASDITTSGGELIFDNENILVTFQAIVPEPASISLLLGALIGCLRIRHRTCV